jgi:RNA polymerase sigma factor (sigma-70 family)
MDQQPSETPPEPYERTISLLRAARAGDAEARERLFARYLPRVRQIVALRIGKRLRQLGEIEDIVQEVLLKILGGLEQLEPRSEAHLRNWLARCVENQVIDHARGLSREKRGGGRVLRFSDLDSGVLRSSLLDAGVSTPSEHAQASELAQRFEDALLSMASHHRELIILRAVCGMSFEDLADELGLSTPGAVRVAYSRALRRLEELAGLP